jgi:acetylornithine deacetylase/succinyl-diaminopimelate desuccinylase-like protein
VRIDKLAAAMAAVALLGGGPARAADTGETAFRALFKEMIETDTSADSGDCTALAAKLARRMQAAGFPAQDVQVLVPEGAPKAGNLVAVLPGREPAAKAVLMLGHIDVVNARREDWTRDPFVLVEEDGQFYGRGVSDMKAQDAIWIDTLMRYRAEGYHPRRTIKLALTCGEEGGFANGAGWLAQTRRELIDAGLALSEGGGGDLDAAGRRLAVTVMAAEKVFAVFTLETTGPGGHSSKPRPENPIITLAQGVANLRTLAFPAELNANSRAYFETLAPRVDAESGAAMRRLLADPQDPAANAVLDRSVSWRAMLRTTCIPTQIEGGHAINAQPQRARATINCRLLPGSPIEPVEAAIVRAVADPRVKVVDGLPRGAPRAATPPLTPRLMDPIRAVAAKVFPGVPVTPVQETFGTDNGRLTAVGIPTYGFSALLRGDDAGNIHGLNEHIAVQSVLDARAFMHELIRLYAEQK